MTEQLLAAIARLQTAFDRVKEFPENNPQGWALMFDLRKEVENLLKVAPSSDRR